MIREKAISPFQDKSCGKSYPNDRNPWNTSTTCRDPGDIARTGRPGGRVAPYHIERRIPLAESHGAGRSRGSDLLLHFRVHSPIRDAHGRFSLAPGWEMFYSQTCLTPRSSLSCHDSLVSGRRVCSDSGPWISRAGLSLFRRRPAGAHRLYEFALGMQMGEPGFLDTSHRISVLPVRGLSVPAAGASTSLVKNSGFGRYAGIQPLLRLPLRLSPSPTLCDWDRIVPAVLWDLVAPRMELRRADLCSRRGLRFRHSRRTGGCGMHSDDCPVASHGSSSGSVAIPRADFVFAVPRPFSDRLSTAKHRCESGR